MNDLVLTGLPIDSRRRSANFSTFR
jgi:hypothetical protein